MEAKELANIFTIGALGFGATILVCWYLKTKIAASAKTAWYGAPTLAGFLTFCFWLIAITGTSTLIGGVLVGGRMVLLGAPTAMAQTKGK